MAFNALARLPNSSVGPDVCSKSSNDTDKNDMLSHHPSCQDPTSMTLNVDDLYSSQTPEKSHHSCLLPKIKEAKELQGIMLSDSDLYCSGVDPGPIDVGNSVNSVSMSSSMMVMMNTASSSGNDYSMLPNFDSSLSHVNNMNILSLPNIFHTSETDSEVALTLASLGDPKNEKLEQSAAVVENFAGDNIEKTLSNGLTDNISSLNSNATESCISNTVNNQTFQKKDYFSSASENVIHKSILSSDQMSSDKVSSVEPTLVLRSRRARGSACSNQQRQHNFPDPERISRKRRKKDASSKHTLEKIPLQVTDVISKNTGATPHVLHTSSSQMGDTLIEDTHLYCQLQNQLPTSKDSSSTLNSTEKLYFLGKEFSFSESQLSPLEAANDQKQLHNLNKEPRSDDLSSLQSSKSTAEPSSVCVDSNVEDSHLDTFSNVMLAANSILDGHFSSQKTVESVNIYNQDGRVFQRYHPNSSGIHSSANSTQVLPSSVFSLPSSTTLIHPTVAPCYAVNCSVEQNSDFTTSNDVRISAVQCPMGTTDINVFASNKNEFASSLNAYPHTSVSQTPQSFPLISSTFTSTSNSFTSLNSLVPSSNNLGQNKLGGDHFFSLQSSDFQGPNCLQSSGSAQSVPTVTQSFSNSSTSYLPVAHTQNTFSHTLYESNTSATAETLPQVEQGASKSVSCSYSNAINGEATLQNSSNTGKNEQAQVISNSREKVIGESGGLATVLLLPVTSAGISEKENLLGQLLKASEHCEPASLIPAGVVNDVIPAVGYRILEVSNLSEMMRSMHCCSGSSVPGTIVIQERASLREGAVSQLSVICTACQEGTVCATSNRVASDGSAAAAPGSAWDINLRVQQLAQEFGLTEHQVQRMLEILGIFYRPCDPPTIADPRSSSNADSSLRCEGVPAGNADISAAHTEQNTDGVTLTSRRTASHKTAELKFESLQNLSVSNNNTNNNGGACTKTSKKKTKKNKKSSPAEPKPKTISCTECPAKFAALNHLKKHALSHNLAQHTCPYCHSYFKKPYNLREHIKKHQSYILQAKNAMLD
ncbi:uncharacterized protein LOC108672033 [Hyalella azteca]|uniref:Uncharacterized protein LOC108672033 n=1 Tax=Hyalella azteca TaxID=294128 RepID=A0A8B7NN78_HYAAZ|nr:uncharacterized protein LOC108672033 [Hyalella azteca]